MRFGGEALTWGREWERDGEWEDGLPGEQIMNFISMLCYTFSEKYTILIAFGLADVQSTSGSHTIDLPNMCIKLLTYVWLSIQSQSDAAAIRPMPICHRFDSCGFVLSAPTHGRQHTMHSKLNRFSWNDSIFLWIIFIECQRTAGNRIT